VAGKKKKEKQFLFPMQEMGAKALYPLLILINLLLSPKKTKNRKEKKGKK
jgi:hypothetical protein